MGRRLVDGVQLRSMPPIEGVWIGTFNLRWWQHAEHKHDTIPSTRRAVRPVFRHSNTM